MKTSSNCLLAACLQGNSAAVFAKANTKTQQTNVVHVSNHEHAAKLGHTSFATTQL